MGFYGSNLVSYIQGKYLTCCSISLVPVIFHCISGLLAIEEMLTKSLERSVVLMVEI